MVEEDGKMVEADGLSKEAGWLQFARVAEVKYSREAAMVLSQSGGWAGSFKCCRDSVWCLYRKRPLITDWPVLLLSHLRHQKGNLKLCVLCSPEASTLCVSLGITVEIAHVVAIVECIKDEYADISAFDR